MTNTSSNILIKEKHPNGIMRLILNDCDNKNALSENMLTSLVDAIKDISNQQDIKVIIIASTGNVFSSGHNLKEISSARDENDNGESYFINLFNLCSSMMQMMVNCPKPIIAEINGIATAAGCQLVASCDLALASSSSKFATPGVNIGLFCSTPMVAISRNISKKDSMKMLLTGDMISADEAKRISLINDFVPNDQLTKSVMDLAKKISEKSQAVLRIGKEAFYKQSQLNIEDAYEYTSMVMTKNMMIDDAFEGISSFLDKRNPKWKNK